MLIRRLQKQEEPPYPLLLVADEELQAIERYLYKSSIYVIESNQVTVGVYVLCPIDEHIVEIKAIAVEEAYQNRGIGKMLLGHAEVTARENGYHELVIGTPTTSTKQLSIYQRAGFELFDIKKDFFITHYSKPIVENGVRLTDMAMLRKPLP